MEGIDHMGVYCWLWELIHSPLSQSNYVGQGEEIVLKVGSCTKSDDDNKMPSHHFKKHYAHVHIHISA